jgi:hypothetical protein
VIVPSTEWMGIDRLRLDIGWRKIQEMKRRSWVE